MDGGRRRVVVHRGDNVTLEMRSYDRKFRVPHDLAHAVTERELKLSAGVFGCIAAGAVFSSMRVLTGSPRHDAATRSVDILKANTRSISVAEVLSGIVHDSVEGTSTAPLFAKAQEAWGIVEERPFPYTQATLTTAAHTLNTLAERWSSLTPGEELELTWPQALTASIPTARR
ncbi:hypothetical protein [Nocardia sp. NPDC005998]|uniref:hypothetical protein n=1 Tax=Nocardia sp. NPDC005998 TaxID=3156894 RepID=UPI0033AA49DB